MTPEPVIQQVVLTVLDRLDVPSTDSVKRIVDERLRAKPAVDVTITTVTRDYSGVTED